PPMRPVSKHAVTFVIITVFLDMVGFGMIMPVLPALIGDVSQMSLAEATIIGGWMYFAFAFAQFMFSPLMGNLSDRYGRRPLLLLAVFGLGIDYIVSALAPSLFWLFVGRAIAGLCGSSYVIANAYIADVTVPEDRAKAFGLIGAAFGVGFVAGPAIGGMLGEFGPRVPFWAAAAISLLNFAYGWFVLPETLTEGKRRPFEWRRANPFGTLKVFRTYPGVLPLCLVLFLYMFASSVYPAVWPFWGIAKFDWSPYMVGLSLAAFGLVTAICQGTLTGPAVARWGEVRVCLIGLVAAVLGLVGYGLATGMVMVVLFMLVHAPEGFVHPMLTAIMSRAVPEDAQGELQGGISSVMNLAMLCGTVFFAQVFGFFLSPAAPFQSPDMAYFIAAAVIAVPMLLFLTYARARPVAA
ncbi:MAG: TCR/Tet family MFS transporter, partial [Gemmobacter sp.]